MQMKLKLIIVVTIVAAVIIAAGGFWYWSKRKTEELQPVTSGAADVIKTKDGLGAESFNKSNNPLSNELPETNPFYLNTNPFK